MVLHVPEEEKEMGYFSPQINGSAYVSQSGETRIKLSDAEPSLNSSSVRAGECLEKIYPVQSGSVNQDFGLANLLDGRKDITATSVINAEDRNSNQIHESGTHEQVSVDDVLCGSCKQMLFRPIILNCGHGMICCHQVFLVN